MSLGLAFVFASGCGWNERNAPERDAARGGKDEVPQRIVCGSPAVAEIVFALGLADCVVGVSDYTIYPPAAKAKTNIGGITNPNRERILILRPDIIVGQGQNEALAAFAREYGVRLHAVRLDSLEDIYAAIDSISGVLGAAQNGRSLKAAIRRELAAVRAAVADRPPRRVLLVFGRSSGDLGGMATVGPGTFLDDIIRVAGGTNIFADAKGAYPQVSKETLLVRRPEVILEVNPDGLDARSIERLRADWSVFPDLPAVRENRIRYLTNDFLLIPGPRVGRIAKVFADAIHEKPL